MHISAAGLHLRRQCAPIPSSSRYCPSRKTSQQNLQSKHQGCLGVCLCVMGLPGLGHHQLARCMVLQAMIIRHYCSSLQPHHERQSCMGVGGVRCSARGRRRRDHRCVALIDSSRPRSSRARREGGDRGGDCRRLRRVGRVISRGWARSRGTAGRRCRGLVLRDIVSDGDSLMLVSQV